MCGIKKAWYKHSRRLRFTKHNNGDEDGASLFTPAFVPRSAGQAADPVVPLVRVVLNIIMAIGLADAIKLRLRVLLIHSLRSEGQRIFYTLGPAETYADCVALLAGHFAAP